VSLRPSSAGRDGGNRRLLCCARCAGQNSLSLSHTPLSPKARAGRAIAAGRGVERNASHTILAVGLVGGPGIRMSKGGRRLGLLACYQGGRSAVPSPRPGRPRAAGPRCVWAVRPLSQVAQGADPLPGGAGLRRARDLAKGGGGCFLWRKRCGDMEV